MSAPAVGNATASLTDRLKALPQYALPHHLLCALMWRITRLRRPAALKNLAIRSFARVYGVDLEAAEHREAAAYASFNDFFTRALRPGTRPVSEDPVHVACPVDAAVSEAGPIESGRLVQAKGRYFALASLLGGDEALARRLEGGVFATLYLSPRDYHRIHMPVDGTLRTMTYVPGRLFSVSPATTRAIPGLFARNERVVSVFDSVAGELVLVAVGALFVGSIETVWAGPITPSRDRRPASWSYPGAGEGSLRLARGDEWGRFNMGSTVILLAGPGRVRWRDTLRAGARVRVGETIGELLKP